MRLLFVVQRYGHEVAGGAERFARDFATKLRGRGAEVEVLTSRAKNYMDWADHYPAGTEQLDGVPVHRLGVVQPRSDRLFAPIHYRVINGRKPIPFHLQEAWMEMQGPRLLNFREELHVRSVDADAVIFFTYLYFTTWAGLPIASATTTTVLHPTAHDEAPLHLPLFELTFRLPDGFGFLVEEELALVRNRFGVHQPFALTGVGVDLEARGDEAAFRALAGLGERPYLLYVGRLDPHKGATELFEFFVAYKQRNPGPLALAVVGEPVVPLPEHPDVFVTGFVDEQAKHDAFSGCIAYVHPSYFESFSIVLAEAWAHRKPALVQGHCDVLVGQARRSGGAIPYEGFAEFEAGVDFLMEDAKLRTRLGDRGRVYVERRYDWNTVLDTYETFLASLLATRSRVRLKAASTPS